VARALFDVDHIVSASRARAPAVRFGHHLTTDGRLGLLR
jgi:elongation factor P hydroxylase